jgi:pyridoxamine 5'-phosphate oxidase
VFYTNLESRKAEELAENPVAALAFHWSTIGLQVRVEGKVEPVEAAQADAYFAHRPRGSQIGAWASAQSKPIQTRTELELRVAELTETYADGEIPRPSFWSGFRVLPSRIEFWHDRDDRLHDRFLYTRVAEGWTEARLSP